MRAMPLPECLGTVVVHRADAVNCTRDSCPRDVPLETWFSFHTSFVMCRTRDCPHCVFDAPVQMSHGDGTPTSSGARRHRRSRLLEPVLRRHV